MRLVTNTQVSVDGVMQANGGNDPLIDPGFDRGGWAMPFDDDESNAAIGDYYLRADAFLFGRNTYDLFARYWGGVRKDDVDDPFVRSLNSRPKFVVSNTITEPEWADTTVLAGDGDAVEASIRELKARPGGELQVHGSGRLIRWLLERELVDELTLITYPVIVGGGRRLFAETGRDFALELLESRTFEPGITMQTFRPVGRPRYA
ncbi:dihydrofolate reductase [Agromyces sp. CFH 90414]|uniref:Dihydrofolate reductase n=1 Tax=Agromyces agglutinans TaxID=2662258 RepID=A0A6I2F441_9MICO|nr:dihydrofolate reductase family protein [Agromyces agglutinans]MRG60255.1 dihydrofolate reductase [Agromyces agglutinans]